MNLTLKVWRQKNAQDAGRFETYAVQNISTHMSFLEMLDVLNENLIGQGKDPVAFDHDCREGICGTCGMMINGRPHGPRKATTTCQLHMRSFNDGDTIVIEPFRAKAFPVVRDLVVDRSPFDRIIQSGGFISASTGSAPEANSIPVPKSVADEAMNAAACIGCGACVAACPNAAAMLFTGAKISHLGLLPQGQPERWERVRQMVETMDAQEFGHCTNAAECTEACPKEIPIEVIARMNRDYIKSTVKGPPAKVIGGGGP
ncbi:MAG TPA: succinate dehydrogenase/fumarate reductase iron-sulfur subunit [Planctomycetota bacterium]|jgi:succinate dehydrogenase / fumarate reductase iron-sulfur subunit|nr:succinate dehydrogenase/fumarate reductase iron-sulfur subunit [Planctomycetota bacterium]